MHIFAQDLLDTLCSKATASPRKRAHHNVHRSPADRVQRFFVAADPDTYFRPHRHHSKSELVLILRGRFEIVTFDDSSHILGRQPVGNGTHGFGYELPAATWHTLVTCEPGSAFFEVKEGPYDPAVAAEFAEWAPLEGAPQVPAMLEWLRTGSVGSLPPV